ncbi:hypothetical protein [Actinophytocola algeriensis]|uniref:Uncharacterized protein n=1 Tax=Actinophytocola algeriensis TaxID=1768010 RepID=A0A7W7Q3R1_9PSEU|nr:hypothetical protein [Actinophytocola algeriensis]MBB4906485.1 hypothetical protein [Actinophytocola algeriensis]MBE1477966.1 hypothetical protein [Actinophytocola algeriensis]
MTDIKDLLGKAIGDEPPIGIDRDEVFRAGRQRVRRRKALAAGGVVAAVVVAAVGAATLTNFVSLDSEPTPPAVGDSQHAPPGPDLPLPSTPVSQKPPPLGPRLTSQHAEQLTDRLFHSWYVSSTEVVPWHGDATPGFRVEDGTYRYQSDLTSPNAEGVLQMTVDFVAPGTKASCGDILGPYDSCAVVPKDGVAVAQATWKSPAGERRNLAVTVLPDGTRVTAMTSNFSRRFSDAGKVPSGGEPVLDMEKLTTVMVKSGFSVF